MQCSSPAVALLGVALFASPAFAQSVWTVDDDPGPGVDFADVQAAVDAASSGDLILVREGTYLPFTVDGVGLSIVGDGPGVKLIQGPPTAGGSTIANLPAGQLAVVRGLRLAPLGPVGGAILGTTLDVRDCAGSVWIEECELPTVAVSLFGSLQQITALGVDGCDEVFAVDCLLQGQAGSSQPGYGQEFGSRGATFTDSTAYLYDCTIAPGYSDILGTTGQTGALVEDALVVLRGSSVTGGFGGPGQSLFQQIEPGDGGTGVVVAGTGELWTIATTLAGGQGGVDDFGTVFGDVGDPIFVEGTASWTDHPAVDVDLTTPAIVRSDDDAIIDVTTDPGSIVFLLVNLELDGVFIPAFPDASAVGLDPIVVPIANTDGAGLSSIEIGIPILPPGLVFKWTLQAAVITPTTGLELSEPTLVHAIAL